jgi:hypothetical protein
MQVEVKLQAEGRRLFVEARVEVPSQVKVPVSAHMYNSFDN